MKKLFNTLLAAALFTVSTAAFAQDDQDDWDSDGHYNSRHKDNFRKSIFNKRDFGLILGINSFDKAYDMPELDTWASRYVALQWRRNNRLITGNQVDVALGTGLELAWNNFMMRHDEQYFENGNVSDFELTDVALKKSKLVVNSLNLPVMLQFGFKESNFRFGVGAYGGMRINSYQKFQEYNDLKYKEKGEYNLRKFNYGLMAEAGRGDLRLFAKYDMNSLFNDNNPINANVLTVGLRL